MSAILPGEILQQSMKYEKPPKPTKEMAKKLLKHINKTTTKENKNLMREEENKKQRLEKKKQRLEKRTKQNAEEEEAARIKGEEEEAARIKAEEEEAARIKAEEKEAARINAQEELKRKQPVMTMEEAREIVKETLGDKRVTEDLYDELANTFNNNNSLIRVESNMGSDHTGNRGISSISFYLGDEHIITIRRNLTFNEQEKKNRIENKEEEKKRIEENLKKDSDIFFIQMNRKGEAAINQFIENLFIPYNGIPFFGENTKNDLRYRRLWNNLEVGFNEHNEVSLIYNATKDDVSNYIYSFKPIAEAEDILKEKDNVEDFLENIEIKSSNPEDFRKTKEDGYVYYKNKLIGKVDELKEKYGNKQNGGKRRKTRKTRKQKTSKRRKSIKKRRKSRNKRT